MEGDGYSTGLGLVPTLELGGRSLLKLPDPDHGGISIRGRGRVIRAEVGPEMGKYVTSKAGSAYSVCVISETSSSEKREVMELSVGDSIRLLWS